MGAMNELFAFFWELAQAIWENFNCAEGKIIVGALINFFLLIGTMCICLARTQRARPCGPS